jgi:hypothetical protein
MKDGVTMVALLVPLLVLVVGALVYALAANPKLQDMGRIAYFVGLLWLVYDFATRMVHF